MDPWDSQLEKLVATKKNALWAPVQKELEALIEIEALMSCATITKQCTKYVSKRL